MKQFSATIEKIGVNPFVFLPEKVLNHIFWQAGKNKGAIPVCGKLDGYAFIQTLVKYSGAWRLYLNIPMRKAAGKDVGDSIKVEIEFDPVERITLMNPKLKEALEKNKKAKSVFDQLSASLQKEIVRYIAHLKTEESVERNIKKAILFLTGKERFIGRNKP